ncbi:hypothetical protein EIP91_001380 [Steccherinum ochraceum]|uniref:PX domain-containing protein n=1 Tax=Steccherinum ochraceum TaxID=92696 RepID=A0A4R0RI22_9APHY|nr:hypothetical protein EIP91_001380 [Steccherinum ochraceum]
MSFNGTDASEARPGTGVLGGSLQTDIKRAVIRAAPRNFFAQVLPPTKIGGHFSYGLRVCPILSDNQSCVSTGSNREYEVWRRWEDCLWFQEVVEFEYSHLARSKRNRLAAGKGVKKDGIYIHSDGAASFDSLPPGPDANSVALDIHEIVPKLSKKGTFFKPSQATVDQRGREFKAMIEGFLDEGVPTLVRELRDIRVIRDFFGIWRRDTDNYRKEQEAEKKAASIKSKSRASVSSSTLSMYFSPFAVQSDSELSRSSRSRSGSETSHPASASRHSTSPRSVRSQRTTVSAAPPMTFLVGEDGALMSPVDDYTVSRGGLRSAPVRPSPRFSVPYSVAPSETLSEAESAVPIMFVSGDERVAARMTIDRHPGLQALPEDEELSEPMSRVAPSVTQYDGSSARRPRGHSTPERALGGPRTGPLFNRVHHAPDMAFRDAHLHPRVQHDTSYLSNAHMAQIPRIPGPGSNSSNQSSVDLTSFSDISSRRNSATSVTSIASNPSTEPNSDVDKALPDNFGTPQTPQFSHFSTQSHFPRDSFATVDSFIASSVMESILPPRRSGSPMTPNSRRSFSVDSRQSRIPSDIPDEAWDERDSIMAAYFYDPSLRSVAEEVPEEPTDYHRTEAMISNISTPQHYPKPYQHRTPGQFHIPWNAQTMSIPEEVVPCRTMSPPSPISPQDSVTSFPSTFTIKAVKEDAIVLLRADASMGWLDVRAKIAEKFEAQEGTPLTKSFLIGYVPNPPPGVQPAANKPTERGRPRASSTSSVGLLSARGGMRTISSDEEWQKVIAGSNGKLALRILDRF